MAHGDPKRAVGAYLTSVERSEQELMAATTAKAVEEASGAQDTPRIDGQRLPIDPTSVGSLEGDGARAIGSGQAGPRDGFLAVEGRWGSREVEIVDVVFLGADERPSHVFHTGDPMSIVVKVRAKTPTDDFVFGVGLFSAEGVCCYGTNTYLEEMSPERLSGEADATFAIDGLDLVEGTYKVDVAVHKRDGYPYDYHRLLYTFRVKSRTRDVGIYRPRHHWRFSSNVVFKDDRR